MQETILLFKHGEKLEQVRDVVMKVEEDSLESLEVVDKIQRLGLGYYFKDEIEAILHHQYLANHCDHDLYEASVRFPDFLGKFVCRDEGDQLKFKGGLVGEMKGLMAMHEASHLNMGGEEILHEAAVFSSHHLTNKCMGCLDDDDEQSKMAKYCLLYPQHKSLPHFSAKNYLTFLKGEYPWEHLLRELAEFESVNIESLHKHEVLRVVEWWKGVGIDKELKSSRNQPLKWHMWSMAILENPRCSKQRILLTKPISLVYAVDDIFDLYGTIHELTHFTEAWGSLMDAFLKEAKWLRSSSGDINAEEYLKNGVISSGVPMVLSHLYFLMGNPLTNQTHLLLNDPNGLTHSVAKLLRLLDDLGTAQDEQQEGYDGSYVEMCMKEGKVDSLEGGREQVMSMVWDTWEKMNEHAYGRLNWSSPLPLSFRHACLNAARMVPTMYTYHQNHYLPLLQPYLKSMFQHKTFPKSTI
ncbi:hypothetical protein C2S52_011040 [Perilla frutescens var. hirtella]|nr:hypothetical protein C2S52_011040 [Perilla frutescens var. hirtella]